MKILIYIHSLRGGGAERVTVNLSQAWVDCGHEVCIVTLYPVDDDFYEVDSRVKRIALGTAEEGEGSLRAAWDNSRRVFALRRVLKVEQPDLIIGTMTRASVVAILAARGLSCRVAVTEHNHPPMLSPGRLWNLLRRLTYRYADEVIALTRESAQWLVQHCHVKEVSIIPNAVVWPISVAPPVLCPSTLCDPERRLLLAVGRLVPQKGFDFLIEAFKNVAHGFPNWDLVILGEGPARPLLEKRIEELNLHDRIALPGRVGNVSEWYARADTYVLSSRFEGFPMTLIEAMASGVAVVSYDCETGPRDVIDAGWNGLLVAPVGDVAELAKALTSMMEDAQRRKQMASRAVVVREKFSSDAIGQLWNNSFSKMGLQS